MELKRTYVHLKSPAFIPYEKFDFIILWKKYVELFYFERFRDVGNCSPIDPAYRTQLDTIQRKENLLHFQIFTQPSQKLWQHQVQNTVILPVPHRKEEVTRWTQHITTIIRPNMYHMEYLCKRKGPPAHLFIFPWYEKWHNEHTWPHLLSSLPHQIHTSPDPILSSSFPIIFLNPRKQSQSIYRMNKNGPAYLTEYATLIMLIKKWN